MSLKLLISLLLVIGFVFPAVVISPVFNCMNLSTPGTMYVLQNDILNSGAWRCINITASNVVLNCDGYMIDSAGVFGSEGIHSNLQSGVTIANCTIQDFDSGIVMSTGSNFIVRNVTVRNTDFQGIQLNNANNVLAEHYTGMGGDAELFYANTVNNVTLRHSRLINGDTGAMFRGANVTVFNLTLENLTGGVFDLSSNAGSPGIGLLIRGTGNCDASRINAFNTSSLAVYLDNVFNCNLSYVDADYGAYDGNADGFVSVHNKLSYLDGSPNTNVWNITASRSFANQTQMSGCIGLSVTKGFIENITAHDCMYSGMGISLGNGSVARNLLAYNNGIGGVVVIAGHPQNFFGAWSQDDIGTAEAYNLIAYNNGWAGVVAVVINQSNISNVLAHSTGPNYWGINLPFYCDPAGLGLCLPLTPTTRFGAIIAGADLNFAMKLFNLGAYDRSQAGTLRNFEVYNSSIGVLSLGLIGTNFNNATIYNNSREGMWINNSAGSFMGNLTVRDNGGDGISIRSMNITIGMIFADSRIYNNSGNGIIIYNTTGGGISVPGIGAIPPFPPALLRLANTSIHDNNGNGVELHGAGGFMGPVSMWLGLGIIRGTEIYENQGRGVDARDAFTMAGWPPMLPPFPFPFAGGIYRSSIHNNTEDGFASKAFLYGQISHSSIYGNGGQGFVSELVGFLRVYNASFYDNNNAGFRVTNMTALSEFDRVEAYGNRNGFNIYRIFLSNFTNSNFYGNGFDIFPGNSAGFAGWNTTSIIVRNCTFNDNALIGFAAVNLSHSRISNSAFDGNGFVGFATETLNNTNITNCTFNDNENGLGIPLGSGGFIVTQVAVAPYLVGIEASGNTADGLMLPGITLHLPKYGPNIIDSEFSDNGGRGALVAGGVNFFWNSTFTSNEIGLEMRNPVIPYPRPPRMGAVAIPYIPFSVTVAYYSHFEGNDQDDVLVNFPSATNTSPVVGFGIMNTTFDNAKISLGWLDTNGNLPAIFSMDSRDRFPAFPPETYDPLGRYIDIESPTSTSINVTAIHYEDGDKAGRNLSNLEVLEYEGGTWSVVPNQVHNASVFFLGAPRLMKSAIVFFNHSTFSTFGLFENSTDYKPPEDEPGKDCVWDEDCPECYYCSAGDCVLDPRCGEECLTDEDCAYNEVCDDGECIPVECGDCEYIENHACVDYECCDDEDCPSGYECIGHECEKEEEEPEPEPEPEPEVPPEEEEEEAPEPEPPVAPVIQTEVPSVESPQQPITTEQAEVQEEWLWLIVLMVILFAGIIYAIIDRRRKKKKAAIGEEE